jgi:hypothetical protein
VFPIGFLVSLTDDEDVVRLAQVETHQLLPDGQMQAAGRILGALVATVSTTVQWRSLDRRP